MIPKKVSDLKEGEWLQYGLKHTPNVKVTFSHEYGKIEGFVWTLFSVRSEDGLNLYLTPAILDQLQQEIVNNEGFLEKSNLLEDK